jgi:hypothetical protein
MREVLGPRPVPRAPDGEPPRFATPFSRDRRARLPEPAVEPLVRAANGLLEGEWSIFGIPVEAGLNVDWFLDPSTGRRAPSRRHAFRVPYRNPDRVGDAKFVWELSRHHHLTLLAAAYFATRDARYADRVVEHLESWWSANPFLRGIHWTSGIELGMRLIAWTWIRRLLHDWEGVAAAFEENGRFVRQLYDHQRFLARFPSHGSSANNHLLAEAAGLFSSSCGFPWFPESARWRAWSAEVLRREIPRQTDPSGLHREMAFAYHGFALELSLNAALEGEAGDASLGPEVWDVLSRMMDGVGALLDAKGNPPRFGDDDAAVGLLLDPPDWQRWRGLLATGAALFGRPKWWPISEPSDIRTAVWSSLAAPPRDPSERPARPQRLFSKAGLALLVDRSGSPDEIWCLCHHGPLGFLSTAAHGHAHALSFELRYGGTPVLVDPGTHLYYGPAEWRDFFRSTRAHNTLEVAGADQSVQEGRFLWSKHARARLLHVDGLEGTGPARWSAEHAGYTELDPPVVHRREVTLLRTERALHIRDYLESTSTHPCRLFYHLGPGVTCRLTGEGATLHWHDRERQFEASLALPDTLDWHTARGEEDPIMGWYSSEFGDLRPTTTLVGEGRLGRGQEIHTALDLPRPTDWSPR